MPVDREQGVPGGLRGFGERVRVAGRCTEYITGRCGAAAIVGLVKRTQDGRDYDGNAFQDFSTKPGYFGYGSESATKAAHKSLVGKGLLRAKLRRGARKPADPLKNSLSRAASRHRQAARILKGGQASAARQHGVAAAGRGSTSVHYFPGGFKQYKLGRGYSYPQNTETGRLLGANGFTRPFAVTERGERFVVVGWVDAGVMQYARAVNEARPFFRYGRIPEEKERLQQVADRALGAQFKAVLGGEGVPAAGNEPDDEGTP